jgi:Dimerisation domain of Zinc Transporter
MDEVTDPSAVAELRRIISEHADGVLEAHGMRTRTAGSVTFVEFHLVVPRRMAVEEVLSQSWVSNVKRNKFVQRNQLFGSAQKPRNPTLRHLWTLPQVQEESSRVNDV